MKKLVKNTHFKTSVFEIKSTFTIRNLIRQVFVCIIFASFIQCSDSVEKSNTVKSSDSQSKNELQSNSGPQQTLTNNNDVNIIVSTQKIALVEGGATASYSITLSGALTDKFTIKIYSEDVLPSPSEVKINPTNIVFNSENFNIPQKIVVSYLDNNNRNDTIVSYTIKHRSSIDIGPNNSPEVIASLIDDDSGVVDRDNDGLLEIYTPEMLNNVRYDLTGSKYKTSSSDPGRSMGCPSSGCNGYELIANIDLLKLLDKNANGSIETTTIRIDKNGDGDDTDIDEEITVIDTNIDESWIPIGTDKDWTPIHPNEVSGGFTGIFEGNSHSITNLWVRQNSQAGLFGTTLSETNIKNILISSGSVYSSSFHSGGLVGHAIGSLTIRNCKFISNHGIFSSFASGGLVGYASNSLAITSSHVAGSGGIFTSSLRDSTYSGGLVGYATDSLIIKISYFYANGGVSTSSLHNHAHAGGLVGKIESSSENSSQILYSKFFKTTSKVSAFGDSAYSGGLVGLIDLNNYNSSIFEVKRGYFSSDSGISSQGISSAFSGGLIGKIINGDQVALTITNSNVFSENRISASAISAISGGLVGDSSSSLTVINSDFTGSGDVFSNSPEEISSSTTSITSTGGLVGKLSDNEANLIIKDSHFSSRGGVSAINSSSSSAGGLVGHTVGSLEIINSYLANSGGISSSSYSSSYSGGLVGKADENLTITRGYINNGGKISSYSLSSSLSSSSSSGGMVGASHSDIAIINSYFDGDDQITSDASSKLASSSFSGGLLGTVANNSSMIIANSYFSGGGVSAISNDEGFSNDNSSPSLYYKTYSGGLAGHVDSPNSIIVNSYFSSSAGVKSYISYSSINDSSNNSFSGGLVGANNGSIAIINSYFYGDQVSSYSAHLSRLAPPDSSTFNVHAFSGGLTGKSTGNNLDSAFIIKNSYFYGNEVLSHSYSALNKTYSFSFSGGFVGYYSEYTENLTITNSYVVGNKLYALGTSNNSNAGSFIGSFDNQDIPVIINSYWNTDVFQRIGAGLIDQTQQQVLGNSLGDGLIGVIGLTKDELRATNENYPNNLLSSPNPSLDSAWDLGSSNQLPALKTCILAKINNVINWKLCSRYDSVLLSGQAR